MRRTVLLVASAALVVLLASGVVFAAVVGCLGGDCIGTRAADTITGTDGDDRIVGMEGNDAITGGAGSDVIYADEGNDTVTDNTERVAPGGTVVYGDQGNDTINVQTPPPSGPGSPRDEVHCGPGKKDKVFYNEGADTVAKDCEIKRPA